MLGAWWAGLQDGLPSVLVWGLVSRGIGLVYLISFLSLMPQTVQTAGRRGGMPIGLRLQKVRQDFGAPQRYWYFPTLLWLHSGNAMLRLLPALGVAAACLVIYGGPFGLLGLALCYLCYLSLDMPMGLIFPWDCLLFEATWLGFCLPATLPLPELASTTAPLPAVAWVFRLLLFRVMFGFGKQKFFGSRSQDSIYLRGFLTAQPLPSPLGWYAQKLPAWVLRLMLYAMFLVEIPGAMCALLPGPLSVVAAVSTAGLMVGIWLFGSFGYFSLLTMVLCLPLVDNSTPLQFSWAALTSLQNLPIHALLALHTFGALLAFPFNSWVGQSWTLWTVYLRLPLRWLAWPVAVFRELHPYRFVHPYGVFPPHAFPAEKAAVIVEVSWNGSRWYECEFNYFATHERSRPRWVAPHHPRGDQAVIYETYGLNPTTMISTVAGPWDPYAYGTQPAAEVLCQRILQGDGLAFVRSEALASHSEPPARVRLRTVLLQPESTEAARTEGRYWKRWVIGPHTPERALNPSFWAELLPEPEQWNPESVFWRRRSRLGRLMRRARAGEPIHQAVIADTADLSAVDVQDFWEQCVPFLRERAAASWERVAADVDDFRAAFDRDRRRRFERLMGRYTVMMEAKLLPLYCYRGFEAEGVAGLTYLHFWMFLQHMIMKGPEVLAEVLAEPERANTHLSDFQLARAAYGMCLFRYEAMVFDAQKLRLISAVLGPYDSAPLPTTQQKLVALAYRMFGYFEFADHLKRSFQGAEYDGGYPERYPVFEVKASGEVAPQGAGEFVVERG